MIDSLPLSRIVARTVTFFIWETEQAPAWNPKSDRVLQEYSWNSVSMRKEINQNTVKLHQINGYFDSIDKTSPMHA